MSFFYFFLIACFLFLSMVLCLVVLVQEGKGGGLGTTFGSSDASDSLFGTSTPEILKKFTAWLAIVFVSCCLILSFWTNSLARHRVSEFSLENQQQTEITS